MKNFFKRLFKRNWQVLAALGFDYVKDNLLGRVRLANPFFGSLLEKAIDLGDQAIDRLTDHIPDDAAQMKQLLDHNYVELVSLTAAGALTEIGNDNARRQVLAILEDTCEKLKGQLPDG